MILHIGIVCIYFYDNDSTSPGESYSVALAFLRILSICLVKFKLVSRVIVSPKHFASEFLVIQ